MEQTHAFTVQAHIYVAKQESPLQHVNIHIVSVVLLK